MQAGDQISRPPATDGVVCEDLTARHEVEVDRARWLIHQVMVGEHLVGLGEDLPDRRVGVVRLARLGQVAEAAGLAASGLAG